MNVFASETQQKCEKYSSLSLRAAGKCRKIFIPSMNSFSRRSSAPASVTEANSDANEPKITFTKVKFAAWVRNGGSGSRHHLTSSQLTDFSAFKTPDQSSSLLDTYDPGAGGHGNAVLKKAYCSEDCTGTRSAAGARAEVQQT